MQWLLEGSCNHDVLRVQCQGGQELRKGLPGVRKSWPHLRGWQRGGRVAWLMGGLDLLCCELGP